MLSQVSSQVTDRDRSVAPTKIIESRNQYQPCHIRVPDLEQPVAAIFVDGEYYSFFRAVKEAEKVLALAAKLGSSGDGTAITKISKGYAIWVREPEAYAIGPVTSSEGSPSTRNGRLDRPRGRSQDPL